VHDRLRRPQQGIRQAEADERQVDDDEKNVNHIACPSHKNRLW
jgi:hypothetical protein